MKKVMTFIAILAFAVVSLSSCSKKDKDGKGTSPAEDAEGYLTGKTQIMAGQKAKAKVIQTAIGQAVDLFRIQEDRYPESLEELVHEGFLNQKYLNDEYGRKLISGIKRGKIFVRSIGPDGKTETSDDWTIEF